MEIYDLAKDAQAQESDFQFVLHHTTTTDSNDHVWTNVVQKLFTVCAKWKSQPGPWASYFAVLFEKDDAKAAINHFKTMLRLNFSNLPNPTIAERKTSRKFTRILTLVRFMILHLWRRMKQQHF
ncbi:Hypothetical protein, putative [Bodo saltans]|uniref:Uncharacterized protein n=1 Tax=Bodo saltans TaxID=75058 RepID=A0A0S4JF04_BODSA|nr:Hypothetical protein, putative [Bodo saltans]|eukprot:CUG88758.1 Hypothetical protein, putative [Bodo saltans]